MGGWVSKYSYRLIVGKFSCGLIVRGWVSKFHVGSQWVSGPVSFHRPCSNSHPIRGIT